MGVSIKLLEHGIKNESETANGEIIVKVRKMPKIGQVVARTFLENKVKEELDKNGIQATVSVKREDCVVRENTEKLLEKYGAARDARAERKTSSKPSTPSKSTHS